MESLNYYEILLGQGKTEEEALQILAARSRDNSRTPMQWSGEANGGFTEGTPWIEPAGNYGEINARMQAEDEDSILHFYKTLIRIRKEKALISKGSIAFLMQDNSDVLAYSRAYRDEELIVLNNLTDREITVSAEPAWSRYEKLLGNYEGCRLEGGSVVLRPFETIALEKQG